MESGDSSDTAFNISDVFCLDIFEQIFSYLNHYELAAVRLVCKYFNHASSYEFGKKSRLVVNPINLPELDNFMQKSSPHFQIRHVRILNLKINESCGPFDCTNLASLPTTINDLEVVESPGIDEKILLQICDTFTSMTTFSFINEIDDTKIDAAYIIGHLCERLKSLTLKIRNVTEHLEVPVITTSSIESLTILHHKHNIPEFKKSKLFAVIAAISKELKHLSLNFWFECWDGPGEYEDDVVVLLSELEWNLQSLELLIEPMDHSSDALAVWIKKIKQRLTELSLHGHFLDTLEFSIFDWICDNCPQLTKFIFECTDNECSLSCVEYVFEDERFEKLNKLRELEVFKAPSRLENVVNKLTNIESIQQLNSHLRHLEIALDAYIDDETDDLGLIGYFKDLTNLKITRVFAQDISIREFMCQFFKNFTSLQVLSFDMLRYEEDDKKDEPLFEGFYDNGGFDVCNLTQLRRIEIRYGHKYMGVWVSFELLAQMPGLQSITFRDYTEEIQLSDIRSILLDCTHLTRLHFTDCKWAEENEAIKSQLIATLPYGRKCSIKVESS